MKNQVTEIEVIQAIGGSQQGPISIDDIAAKVGTIRQVINPALSALVKKGLVHAEKSTSGWPIFSLTEKSAQETAKAVLETEAPRSSPARLEVVRSAAQKVQQKESVAVEQNKEEPVAKTAPALAAVSNATRLQLPATELNVLAYLSQQGRPMSELRAMFGDCEPLLSSLCTRSLIDCDYIIDQHVYTLRSQAYKEHQILSNRDDVLAIFAPQAEKINPQAPEAEAEAEEVIAAQAVIEAIQSSPVTQMANDTLVIDQPAEVLESTPEPVMSHGERERKVVREEFAQEEEFIMSGDIMKEISRLIDRGIREQLEKQRAESAEGIDMKSLAEKLQVASDSLKQAARALDETLQVMIKG
jgi:hypothetical protein